MLLKLIEKLIDKKIDESKKAILEKVDITLKDMEASLETRLSSHSQEINKKILSVKELRDDTNRDLISFKKYCSDFASKLKSLL